MKKLFLLLSVIFLSRIVNSQNWYWARASSGSSVQLATGVAVDGSGNVYVTGFFDGGSITFGTTTVTSAGNRDIFLVKYSPCGNVLWAKSFGGASYDASWSVATDASGNVFVTGYIEGTANFGSVTLTPGGTNPNVFLVKCNPAGVVQWAKNSSGSAPIPPGTLVDNQGHCVSTDAAGNSYITGWFATTNITFAPTTLVNASSSGVPYEVFVVKYDAAGNMVWAKSAQGTQNDFGNSIAADNFGNVYVTGSHMTTINFGNTSLVNSTFNSDMFLVKYDASTGSDLWSTKGIPNNASGPTEIGQTVATDAPGNIYVGGQYSSPYIIFGTDTLFNSQTSFPMTYDYFIAKYNSAGAAQWAKSGGSASGNENGASIAVDTLKGVYLTGTFTSPSITIGTNTLFKTGASDPMFIAEYDVSGNVLCATSLDNGVPDYDNIMDIATDSFGQMFLAGDYAKNPLIIGSNSLPLTGTYNSFSAKFTCGPPLPYAQLSASVTATSAACSSPNGSATATATGGSSPYTFQWSNSQTAQTATGLAAGNYTVTITDANGCSVSSTATITAAASPTVAVSSSPASCSSPTGSATATVSGGNSPYTYNWSSGATTSAATNLSAGNYSVTVTDNSGCTATATVSVSAIGAPTVTATFSNPLCNAGTNGTATATVNGGSSPYTFSWSSGQTTSVATNLSAGNYSVTVTDNSGCSSTQTVMLTQPNAISVSPSSTANTSCVSPNGSATANASGGTSPFTYSWSNGGTTSQISNLTSQIYSVTITDNNGCTATQTVSVAGPTLPTISISGNANITSGQSITISTSASGGNPSYTYAWSPSTGLSCISCANAVATLTETTTYCILITDANGCSDSSCITINVEIPCKGIYVPNAFSPNTDNENDFFRVYFGNILCVKEFKMVVYDRWGEKVFTTADAAFMWDGMYNGTLMQSGVFTYYMYARFDNGDEVNKKGNVTLLK